LFVHTAKQKHKKEIMKNRTSRKSGFTLVEIMIVVAIIGLLAAIAIPNFVRARTTSQKNACINNLRQIDGAVQQWALENKQAAHAAVVTADVIPYLKSQVVCPAGGTTFATSYDVTFADVKPVCKSSGGGSGNGHVMPADTSN
jgi:prepilin-type N-terminal cleavage/methylation domain-containing protein